MFLSPEERHFLEAHLCNIFVEYYRSNVNKLMHFNNIKKGEDNGIRKGPKTLPN